MGGFYNQQAQNGQQMEVRHHADDEKLGKIASSL
jgi:hypothetical protein